MSRKQTQFSQFQQRIFLFKFHKPDQREQLIVDSGFRCNLTSFVRTPADILPTFKTPAVQVVTFYPGMPADVMEADITTRLERWTGQSNGVERQESKSMVGVSVVKDFFRPDIDPNTAMSQVTSLAMSDLYYLPPGTIPPMVMPFDPTANIPLAESYMKKAGFPSGKYTGPPLFFHSQAGGNAYNKETGRTRFGTLR